MFRLLRWWLLYAMLLHAKGYGLIVTIGTYAHLPKLEGADRDREIYEAILRRGGVERIVVLHDQEATRDNILVQLHHIADQIGKRDHFYMFFSGHGSSLYDDLYGMKFQQAGLTALLKDSGAILPYDFDPMHLTDTVIIGKRDLRALLMQIDHKVAFGLVVFDACYSESSIRGENRQINRTPHILTDASGYPYQKIIYVASSIDNAQAGIFAPSLEACLDLTFVLDRFKRCLNHKMQKGYQIPAVLASESWKKE